MAIARYTLAVDRRGRRNQDSSAEQQTADFINCVAFDRAAEFAEKANAKSASEAEVGDASAVSVDNEAASAAAPQTPGA